MRKKKKKKPNEDIQMLAKRIKSLRINQEYTSYEHFAADKEIPRTQYGRYEKGEDIRFTSLVKLADAFGVSLEEFFSKGFGPRRKGKY